MPNTRSAINGVDCCATSVTTSINVSLSPVPPAGKEADQSHLVDSHRQQDSGSNQSTSDSGLGYPHSISSDSSSIVNSQQATRIDQRQQRTNNTDSGGNSNPVKAKAGNVCVKGEQHVTRTGAPPKVLTDLINYDVCQTNHSMSQRRDIRANVANVFEPDTQSPTPVSCDNSIAPKSNRNCETSSSLNTPASSQPSRGNDTLVDKQSPENQSIDQAAAATAAAAPANIPDHHPHDSHVDRSNVGHHATAPQTVKQLSSGEVSTIKSALKKRSPNVLSDGSNKSKKQNRTVSFNQTVVVFCEEFETSSPSEQSDLPVDYRDHGSDSSFDHPEKYCDPRQTNSSKISSDVRDELPNIFNRFVGENSSNLTDEQLFGLLEDEFLFEDFKLNSDEDENEFPLNRLNSDQSYLCHDAISGSDTDSESSLPIRGSIVHEKDVRSSVQASNEENSTKGRKQHQNVSSKTNYSSNTSDRRLASSNDQTDELDYLSSEQHPDQQIKQQVNQKSMPARMKVSTFDSKRQQISRNPNAQRPNDSSSTSTQLNTGENSVTNTNHQQTSSSSESTVKPIVSVMIKQSNIENVPISRSSIVGQDKVIQQNNQATSIMMSDHNRSTNQSSAHDSNQLDGQKSNLQPVRHQYQIRTQPNTCVAMNDGKPQAPQNQPNCHICKALESGRGQTNITADETQAPLGKSDDSNLQTMINHQHQLGQIQLQNQYRGSISGVTNHPIVLNPSCVSCREASTKAPLNVVLQNGSQQATSVQMNNPPRPVAYQLVYVVDQNGNRVRALQCLRPAIGVANQPGLVRGRQVFIAPQGYRLPNPASVAGQIQQANTTRFSDPNGDPRFPHLNHSNLVGQFDQNNNNHNSSTNRGIVVNHQPPNTIGHAPRHHTIYYVRQPLNEQHLRQTMDPRTESGMKSFPDPHEIRRLDGLKGPTHNLSLSQRADPVNTQRLVLYQVDPNTNQHVAVTRRPELKRDDSDDPTFGFSKRPSVKVVATSASQAKGQPPRPDAPRTMNAPNNQHSLARGPLVPLDQQLINPRQNFTNDSQTLDRRHVIRGQLSSQMPQKVTMPSTSSMSNINGTLRNYPDNSQSAVNFIGQEQNLIENRRPNPMLGNFTKVPNEVTNRFKME